jgi:hypothetical protein
MQPGIIFAMQNHLFSGCLAHDGVRNLSDTGEAMGEGGEPFGKGNAPSHRPYQGNVRLRIAAKFQTCFANLFNNSKMRSSNIP